MILIECTLIERETRNSVSEKKPRSVEPFDGNILQLNGKLLHLNVSTFDLWITNRMINWTGNQPTINTTGGISFLLTNLEKTFIPIETRNWTKWNYFSIWRGRYNEKMLHSLKNVFSWHTVPACKHFHRKLINTQVPRSIVQRYYSHL